MNTQNDLDNAGGQTRQPAPKVIGARAPLFTKETLNYFSRPFVNDDDPRFTDPEFLAWLDSVATGDTSALVRAQRATSLRTC